MRRGKLPIPQEPGLARLPASLELSVVVPARDEVANLVPLLDEIEAAVQPLALAWELIVVDDGSRDGTRERLGALVRKHSFLRALSLRGCPASSGGQSAALAAGYRAARGELVASLDADLQNDPRDIAILLQHLQTSGVDLVQGDRSRTRSDGGVRRFGSAVGRMARRALLGDPVRDTGCSLRVMRRDVARSLPLELRGMHRFVPALARQLGYRVQELPVSHRSRRAGRTKYGLGLRRALPGLTDLLAVRYMANRRSTIECDELKP